MISSCGDGKPVQGTRRHGVCIFPEWRYKTAFQEKAVPVNFVYGMNLYAAAKVDELFPWFVIMFAILLVALVVMLMKTRHH